MLINSDRIVGVSYARQNWASMLGDVESGKTVHVMRDAALIAHVVPASALVVDSGKLEAVLVMPSVAQGAQRVARELVSGNAAEAVDDGLGRVLGWLWHCDPRKAVEWFGKYAQMLGALVEEAGCSRLEFEAVWPAVAAGLRVVLSDAAVDDFEAYARINSRWP